MINRFISWRRCDASSRCWLHSEGVFEILFMPKVSINFEVKLKLCTHEEKFRLYALLKLQKSHSTWSHFDSINAWIAMNYHYRIQVCKDWYDWYESWKSVRSVMIWKSVFLEFEQLILSRWTWKSKVHNIQSHILLLNENEKCPHMMFKLLNHQSSLISGFEGLILQWNQGNAFPRNFKHAE